VIFYKNLNNKSILFLLEYFYTLQLLQPASLPLTMLTLQSMMLIAQKWHLMTQS